MFNALGRVLGYHAPEGERWESAIQRAQSVGFVLGVNGGSHGASAAVVRVEDCTLLLNAEEERWTRRKHDWGYPVHAVGEAVRTLQEHGVDPASVPVVCGWDFPAFARNWTKMLWAGLPGNRPLWTAEGGFMDLTAIRQMPARLAEQLGQAHAGLFALPHHDNHAHTGVFLSPFCDGDTLVLVADGMGDAGSISVYLRRKRTIQRLYGNDSFFDSLGMFYQVLSSTQGGWTPLSSEGRFMGASAWGDRSRETNPVYAAMRPLLRLEDRGVVRLDRRWTNWHNDPRRPYGSALEAVIGAPIPRSRLWNPDAVLDPSNTEAPELTQRRLDIAAAVQLLFEDALFHILDHWLAVTDARQLVWVGGTALNCVASLHLVERYPEVAFWVPPIPADGGVAAGAALTLATAAGGTHSAPLEHAFLGGAPLTRDGIDAALADVSLETREIEAEALPERLAELLHRGALLGLAQGAAETGPRALGHRSILADPTRADALERLNAHVKKRERVRPLAPIVTRREAARWFELPENAAHHDLHAYRWMVLCARARPGTGEVLPAVVHRDGTSRLQIADPVHDSLVTAVLEALGARNGAEVVVNTSLNVGTPIAHTATDVVETLERARDLHGIALVDERGRASLVFDPKRPAGAWLRDQLDVVDQQQRTP